MRPPAPLGAIRHLAALARYGDLGAYARQIQRLGGCERPVRMEGHRLDVHAATGEIVREITDIDLPAGQLLIRCNNRRATRCAACAEVYRKDTFHLVTAGLSGGKGIGPAVAQHPRVFATFTAPSFGPVHNRPTGGCCRCGRLHPDDDPALGTPLDPDRYDYRAAVLWNAHAGALWARFTTYLRQQLASRAGLTRTELRNSVKVSYAKVAEYQRRGAVHFHAVIRLDGPEGAEDNPPPWATTELLTDAIHTAAHLAETLGPDLDGRAYTFRFGKQLDIRPIRSADFVGTSELSSRAVAAYIAKYATKGAETAGTLDRPIRNPITDLIGAQVTDHARQLILTCWHLGARPELEALRLRKWAHMLGFRGHFSTKSRAYSVTLGALRQERADHNEALTRARAAEAGHPLPDPDTVLVLSHWRFAGTGLTAAETWFATSRRPDATPDTEGDSAWIADETN
ncbi:replication initiator [Streptomyces neyagawaensis]|uniref:replication initiator n=2 Tax=Streptomyces neyagawaensis TaxID=42238 RepID=UPI00201CCA4E|nr:replication initiator [Streptomyces neyagawaensis]MCL6737250.1 replication initiation protein [Streptomyces neyagawaensis]MDE1687440.1 replication initiation protein [Streptomyces neyagawaensis]